MSWRRFWQYVQAGWFTVTLFYVVLLALSYGLWYLAQRLPGVNPAFWQQQLQIFQNAGAVWTGLTKIWLIFVWGFGLQLLVQINWIIKRRPKDGSLAFLFKRGAWMSLHAGVFEELIFRYYAYLSFVLGLVWLDQQSGGGLGRFVNTWLTPVINVVTLGYFAGQFNASHWALGVGAIIGASFFRSAHLHYGKFSKANVWAIGVVMFWLAFNYGLVTAIVAHFLYDLCVFSAIALASPLQPHRSLAD